VGSLGEALPIAAAPGASASPGPHGSLNASVGLGPDLAPTSALTLAGLVLLSVAATVARRRLTRRQLRTALVTRLAALRDGELAPGEAPAALAGAPERPADGDGLGAGAPLEGSPEGRRAWPIGAP
jgi:hypothetical protein